MALQHVSHQQELKIRRYPELVALIFSVRDQLNALDGATAKEVKPALDAIQTVISNYDLAF